MDQGVFIHSQNRSSTLPLSARLMFPKLSTHYAYSFTPIGSEQVSHGQSNIHARQSSPILGADFDSPNLKEFEVPPLQLGALNSRSYPPSQVECSHPQDKPSDENLISCTEHLGLSQHSSSSSNISTLLSKMSLSLLSSSKGDQESQKSFSHPTVPDFEIYSPILLPGSFPEYCWQHFINKNQLSRCDKLHQQWKCNYQSRLKDVQISRALDPDILSRIAQRNIQKEDLHEIDIFGNTTIHIEISLIKLGVSVNALNNADQTFLHLLKTEVLTIVTNFATCLSF